jgi:hypothetical protein
MMCDIIVKPSALANLAELTPVIGDYIFFVIRDEVFNG